MPVTSRNDRYRVQVVRAASELDVIRQSSRHWRQVHPLAPTPRTPSARLEKARKNHIAGDDREETVLYLAYGSNLCAATFRGVRGIKPLSEINVVTPSLTLSFDLPGTPYTEPCFANSSKRTPRSDSLARNDAPTSSEKTPLLQADYSTPCWDKGLVGVVYEVTPSDYAHIIATEGGGMAYADVLVDCYELAQDPTTPVPRYPTAKPFKAHTLFAPAEDHEEEQLHLGPPQTLGRLVRPDPNYAQPSPRYLDLITTGADEHLLPNDYRAYLNSLQPYVITTKRQKLGRYVFLMTWAPIMAAMLAIMRADETNDRGGKWPAFMIKLFESVFAGLWWSYDHVMKQYYGDGERTEGADLEKNERPDTSLGSRKKSDVSGDVQVASSVIGASALSEKEGWNKV